MGPLPIRPATIADAPGISALICGLSHFFLVDPENHEGNAFFLSLLAPAAIAGYIEDGYIRYHVAEREGEIIGVVGVRDGTHLYHLFVREDQQGTGLGRQLWQYAHREAGGGSFTVNASRNAVGFYEQLGFAAAAEMVARDGLVYLPMRRP